MYTQFLLGRLWRGLKYRYAGGELLELLSSERVESTNQRFPLRVVHRRNDDRRGSRHKPGPPQCPRRRDRQRRVHSVLPLRLEVGAVPQTLCFRQGGLAHPRRKLGLKL